MLIHNKNWSGQNLKLSRKGLPLKTDEQLWNKRKQFIIIIVKFKNKYW